MQELLNELHNSIKLNQNFSTLFVSLCIPDICAAVEYGENAPVGKRYAEWINSFAKSEFYDVLSGEEIYFIRCSVLHQAVSAHKKLKFDSVEFQPLGLNASKFHLCTGDNNSIVINIELFAQSMIRSCENWMKSTTKDYSAIMETKNGSLVVGLPAIS